MPPDDDNKLPWWFSLDNSVQEAGGQEEYYDPRQIGGLIIDMSGGVGTITGEDGSSYNLITEDILVNTKQIEGRGLVGHKVFFIPDGAQAKRVIVRDDILGIYIVAADGSFIGNGDRLISAIIAVLLGLIGAHKFYLGYKSQGILMFLAGTVGWLLIFPPFISFVISIAEAFIYLSKTDQSSTTHTLRKKGVGSNCGVKTPLARI